MFLTLMILMAGEDEGNWGVLAIPVVEGRAHKGLEGITTTMGEGSVKKGVQSGTGMVIVRLCSCAPAVRLAHPRTILPVEGSPGTHSLGTFALIN